MSEPAERPPSGMGPASRNTVAGDRPWEAGSPAILRGGPLLIAHRGGSGVAPENTLEAFVSAVERWGADMIELDVHLSADGRCVVIHDPTLDRTTDGTGPVADRTLAELQRLDAGYRFTPDGERYPFRDRGIRIPALDEVLAALPNTPLIVEVKTGHVQRACFETVRAAGATERVIAAGIHARDRTLFHEYDGPISASSEQCRRFFLLQRFGLGRIYRPRAHVVQVPETWRGIRVVTRRFVDGIHAHGLPVQVWTVDEVQDMDRLLDWDVDGILTDRPDRLAGLLARRFGRPLPHGLRDDADQG